MWNKMSDTKKIRVFGHYLALVKATAERLGAECPPLAEVKDAFDHRMSIKKLVDTWALCEAEVRDGALRREPAPYTPAVVAQRDKVMRKIVCRYISGWH